MRACVLTERFPKVSETFVMDHVRGLLRRNVDVVVLANEAEERAWEGQSPHGPALEGRVRYYAAPRSRTRYLAGLLRRGGRNLWRGRWPFFRSLAPAVSLPGRFYLRLPYLIDAFLTVGAVDVLHCHFGPQGVLGTVARRLGLARRLVVTFHGYDVARAPVPLPRRHPYRAVFSEADLLLPVSERWRDKLVDMGAPAERTRVHRMGVDLTHLPRRVGGPGGGPIRLMTTARFTEKKGLPFALQAVSRVVREHPELDIRYELVGDGHLRDEVEERIRSLDLADRVHLHGSLPHRDVVRLLGEADVFVLPSVTAPDGDQEGIPVSLMEAMARGLPVVATRHSGIPELVDDGASGFLVPERDVEALADRILHLVRRPELRQQMGRAGRRKVEEAYDVARQTDRLLEMYQSLTAGSPVSPSPSASP